MVASAAGGNDEPKNDSPVWSPSDADRPSIGTPPRAVGGSVKTASVAALASTAPVAAAVGAVSVP